jgi:mono/diheme cytochrome c family protein
MNVIACAFVALAAWTVAAPPAGPTSTTVVPAPAPMPPALPPLVVELTGVVAPPTPPPSPALVEAGRKTYAGRCQGCHGVTGAGDGPLGRVLKPAPQRLGNALWQARVSDDELKKVIALGGAAVGRAAAMPAHKDLSPAAIDAVVAFVRSLRAPHGTARITVKTAAGREVVADADADAGGRARITVAGVSGPVTVTGVVDPAGATACSFDIPEAGGASVSCPAKP